MDLFDLVAKISLDSSEYESALNESETETSSFASKLGGGLTTAAKGVATAIAGTTAAVTAVGTAVTAAAKKTAEYGDSIDKSSQKLGVSSSFYQEWEAVLEHSGTSMSSMTSTFKTLSNAVQDGSDDQIAAFEKLGLSMDDLQNMSTEEVFAATISGLQNMEEGTERTALATDLLGKGAMEMGALLNTSAEDTQAMIDQVHNLGGVMSDDAVKASAHFQDSLQDLQTGISGMGTSIMSDILPNLSNLMDFIITQLPTIKDTVSGILNPILEELTNAFTWISDHFDEISAVIQTVLEVITTVFGAAWEACKVIFEAVGDAIADATGDVDGAGVDWAAVADAVAKAIKVAGDIIAGIIRAVGAVIGWLVDEANTDGSFINLAFENMKTIISAAITIIMSVIRMIIDLLHGDFKGAFEQAKEIVSTIFNAIKTIITNDLNTAKAVIEKVLDAIKDKFTKIFDSAKDIVKKAIETIKGFFNFTWKLPDLKLPHFSMDGEFSLNPPSVPTISIDWYAKAMKSATVLDGATIFGAAGGSLLGAGEAGREVVAGEDHLMDLIKSSVQDVLSGSGNVINQTINVNREIATADELARAVRIESRYGLMKGVALG